MPPPCANAIGVARWNQPVRRLIPAHGGPIPGPDQGIPRRIDVSVVRRTTVATYPESFNQPIDPSRTCQGSARKTGDGGVSFIDDFELPGRLPALVFQEVLEQPPAGIQHGLRHPSLHWLKAAHVAHSDVLYRSTIFLRNSRPFTGGSKRPCFFVEAAPSARPQAAFFTSPPPRALP